MSPSLKDFFYSLSDKSIYKRFMSVRRDMPHELLQEFVVIDYSREIVILAIKEGPERQRLSVWGSTASRRPAYGRSGLYRQGRIP